MTEKQITLQDVFTMHFQRDDLEGAKKWFLKFMRDDDQEIPELLDERGMGPQFSQRAMAGHLSDYLEGFTGDEPNSYDGSGKVYWDTKYGSELYFSV